MAMAFALEFAALETMALTVSKHITNRQQYSRN